jgi:hypothetical protein
MKAKSFNSKIIFSKKISIIFILSLSACVFVYHLGSWSKMLFDESIYYEVSKNFLKTHQFLDMYYANSLWFEKPPLYMWISTSLMKVFGDSYFVARLPSAIFGVLLVSIAFIMADKIYDKKTAFISSLILILSGPFYFRVRQGTLDVMLCTFIFIGIYAYIKTKENNQYWYLFGLSLGLGFMTKGFAVIPLLLTVLFDLSLSQKLISTLKKAEFYLGLQIAILIALPWHLYSYAKYKELFISSYYSKHIVYRSLNVMEGHFQPWYFYIKMLIKYYIPWNLLTLPTLYLMIKKKNYFISDYSRPLLILGLIILILYSFFIKTKIFQYVLPLIPIMAIFIARTISYFIESYIASAKTENISQN